MNNVITKEARVAQIVQGARASDIEASVQMAIQSLQAQIQSFYKLLTELKKTDNAGAGADAAGGATVLTLVNRSGAGRNFGDVVVVDAGHARSFTVTATAGDPAVAGVVYSDTPDGVSDAVEAGAEGMVCRGGLAHVNVDAGPGAIAEGDYLISHTTAGYARRAGSRDDIGVFAIALEPLATGTGTITAIITADALVNSESLLALKNFDRSLFEREGFYRPHYDADGGATGFSGYLTSATLWLSPAMSQLAGHWTYRYGVGGDLVSAIHSVYDIGGAGLATVRRAIEYQEERIAQIISEIA